MLQIAARGQGSENPAVILDVGNLHIQKKTTNIGSIVLLAWLCVSVACIILIHFCCFPLSYNPFINGSLPSFRCLRRRPGPSMQHGPRGTTPSLGQWLPATAAWFRLENPMDKYPLDYRTMGFSNRKLGFIIPWKFSEHSKRFYLVRIYHSRLYIIQKQFQTLPMNIHWTIIKSISQQYLRQNHL